jgi:dolichol-phosphate mannosyltransferase
MIRWIEARYRRTPSRAPTNSQSRRTVKKLVLSVVIPCFNESASLQPLAQRLRPVLDGLEDDYEVVFVDDGSRDDTVALIRAAATEWPEVRLCELVRNSGHQAALTAGIAVAHGDYIVTIDADLQDPPELIADMLAMAKREGLDVVYAQRTSRSTDRFLKRTTARIYYRVIKMLTGIEIVPNAGDYRLISRRVAEVLRTLPERRRVYRLLVPWLGFPSGTVEHARAARVAGDSKYTVRKMFSLAVDSVATFSTGPLHLATLLGTITGFASFLAAGGVVVAHFIGHPAPGWASISAAVFFLGSVQLICLGVLGSYVGRIYEEVRHRPLYLIRDEPADVKGSPVAYGQPARIGEASSDRHPAHDA